MEGLTLASVEEAFWGSVALGLYLKNKSSIICRRLGLSGSQFKQRLDSSCHPIGDNGFVLASRGAIKENLATINY